MRSYDFDLLAAAESRPRPPAETPDISHPVAVMRAVLQTQAIGARFMAVPDTFLAALGDSWGFELPTHLGVCGEVHRDEGRGVTLICLVPVDECLPGRWHGWAEARWSGGATVDRGALRWNDGALRGVTARTMFAP